MWNYIWVVYAPFATNIMNEKKTVFLVETILISDCQIDFFLWWEKIEKKCDGVRYKFTALSEEENQRNARKFWFIWQQKDTLPWTVKMMKIMMWWQQQQKK